jgi:hypothetical protein
MPTGKGWNGAGAALAALAEWNDAMVDGGGVCVDGAIMPPGAGVPAGGGGPEDEDIPGAAYPPLPTCPGGAGGLRGLATAAKALPPKPSARVLHREAADSAAATGAGAACD